jgi:Carboxypeptidase regulatory-like domain
MRHIIGVVVAVVCAVAVTSAQQGTADLRGRVVDEQQAAMPGVAVVVRNQASGIFREATSGPDGSFYLGAMTPGTYRVEAALQGFATYKRGDRD